MADERPALADADNAIGQVIRKAESVLLEENPDAKEFARVLLDMLAGWNGGEDRSDEKEAGESAEPAIDGQIALLPGMDPR